MTYSCSEFTDDITNELIRIGLLKAEDLPDDDPGELTNLVFAAVNRLAQSREDVRQAASSLAGALRSCSEQILQMQGMFGDSDGAIAQALEDADEALEKYRTMAVQRGELTPEPTIYVASVKAEGGGTDFILVGAVGETEARELLGDWELQELEVLTPGWLDGVYGGMCYLTGI
ncbi:MAG: hypothetical protein AB1768_19540 [Pseudomonadota bacterium]|jgi:hypothetical protein